MSVPEVHFKTESVILSEVWRGFLRQTQSKDPEEAGTPSTLRLSLSRSTSGTPHQCLESERIRGHSERSEESQYFVVAVACSSSMSGGSKTSNLMSRTSDPPHELHSLPRQFWHCYGSAASIPSLSRLDPSNPHSRRCLCVFSPKSACQAKYLGRLRQPPDSKPLAPKEKWRDHPAQSAILNL